jgi:hypothetical protein
MTSETPRPPERPHPAFPQGAGPARNQAEDGTDLTLIRWMRSLDHRERFQVLQSGARSLALLLDARAEASRDKDAQGLVVLRHLLEERSRRER